MEQIMGVEDARRILGDLVSRVNKTKDPVIITRRAREKAVLLDYEAYLTLHKLAEQAKEQQVIAALERIQHAVAEEGIPYESVDEAIREVRSRK